MILGRSLLAAFVAFAIVLFWAAPVRPSYNSDAERAFDIASRRLAELKKSPGKRRYRSYWFDCIRTFELVENKYAKSPYAKDACFYRADIYRELYQHSRSAKDIDESLQAYAECQSAYPGHPRAPEAFYRIIEIFLYYKKDSARAGGAYAQLSNSYPRSDWTAKAKTRWKSLEPKTAGKRRQTPEIRKAPSPAVAARGRALPGGVVRNVRSRSGGDYTRIVIDHENKVKFEVLELKKPDRLVFDLLDARLDPSVDSGPLLVNDGILRQVRVSQYTLDIVRVVLDLASIKSYAAFPLRDPRRLVIDVMGEKGAGDGDAVAASGQETVPAPASGPRAASSAPVRAPEAQGGAGLSFSRQLGLKVRTIAIDAGHGGRDPGAIGKRGTKEKTITLDIAKRLAALVREGLGCTVVMTRDRDEFIPLEDRPAIARTKGADLFVSIHVNASRKRLARGIETYIQGLRASDLDAMATAARENATTDKTLSELDDELARILTGLRMESNDEDSIHLAHAVQRSLSDAVHPAQGQAADLGVKRAFFYVLINTGMPSILAEVGFISNPADERLLRKPSYRQRIAEALYQGVKDYVDARTPRQATT
jgi:N-acetylmuramoyl-L-alanine amidase